MERSFGVNRGLSRFPSFTHLAFVSQSIFMINFFHSKLCVFEFLFRLRQSHMFLIFVYSRRGDKNWEAESQVKRFCGTLGIFARTFESFQPFTRKPSSHRLIKLKWKYFKIRLNIFFPNDYRNSVENSSSSIVNMKWFCGKFSSVGDPKLISCVFV